MNKCTKIFLRLALLSCLLILPSCEILLLPLFTVEEFSKAMGKGKKDVSDNYERGHVIGRTFVTRMYLTHFQDIDYESKYFLGTPRVIQGGISSIRREVVIPPGTKIRITKVIVRTKYGNELNTQEIYANFIDENDEIISFNKCKKQPFDVNALFYSSTSQNPDENWYFEYDHSKLKEITIYDNEQESECNES